VPSFFVLPYPFIYRDLNAPSLKPPQAYYDESLSEYFLHLESAASANASGIIQEFFQSTFDILREELQWEESFHFFMPWKMQKQVEQISS
jgi:hypothetical protein